MFIFLAKKKNVNDNKNLSLKKITFLRFRFEMHFFSNLCPTLYFAYAFVISNESFHEFQILQKFVHLLVV